MMAASEPVRQLDDPELVRLLRRKIDGEPCPHGFILEEDAYSVPPGDLVRGREPVRGTNQGDGKGAKWCFFSHPIHHCSAQGGSSQMRQRRVPGGDYWRTEASKDEVKDKVSRTVVGYKRTLYYCRKIKDGKKRFQRLGWCMKEFGLNRDDGADKLVLCVVYKSPRTRTDPETSREASVPGGDMPCPAPPPASSRECYNQSPQIAMEGGMSVIVDDSYNHQAAGTSISTTRDMGKRILASIVLKPNIIMLKIESAGALDQSRFLAKSFKLFKNQEMSVHGMATSEGKISVIIAPSELWTRESVKLKLNAVVERLQKFAVVDRLEDKSAISLVGNAEMSAFILEKALSALRRIGVKFEMISEVSSEVTHVSLVVPDSVAKDCEQALRSVFAKDFVSEVQGSGDERPIPANLSPAASTSGVKRKAAGDDHPDPDQAPPGVLQGMAVNTDPSTSAVGSAAFPGNGPIMPDGVGITNNLAGYYLDANFPDDGGDLGRSFHSILDHNPNNGIMFDNPDNFNYLAQFCSPGNGMPGVDGYADYRMPSGAGDGCDPVGGSALEEVERSHQETRRSCGPTERLDYLAMDDFDISRIAWWESGPAVAVVFGGALEGMERGPQETTDKLRIALEKIPSKFLPIGLQLSNGFPVGCCLQRPKERLEKLFAAIRSLAGCWPTSRNWNGQGLRVCLLYVQNQSYQLFGHSQKFGMPTPTCPVSSSFCLSTLAKSWASKTLAKVVASHTLNFGSNQAYRRE